VVVGKESGDQKRVTTMPTLFETISTGAMFTFAPLLLLLAVDLVWSLPVMLNHRADANLHLRNSQMERGLIRE
jgi:hypothetical protein